ncbi:MULTISPECIES: hypothetical protein [Apilactobacillus]|uniref:hypothetical protein n=1 Tax=Apilactobacillus TaxID=2767877 RepID=UPI0012FFF2D8|nr:MULTISPECIES: hypothetical protein [Apilactobacillus]
MMKNNKKGLNLLYLVTKKMNLPTGIYKNEKGNVFNHINISENRLDKLKSLVN